jgi:prepilin-type processing-associated H-X9-DG protein
MTAVNLQTQVFEPLGEEWAFFTDPNIGGNSITGFVLVNRLDDAKTVETALDKLGLAIGNIATAQAQGDGMVFAMRQTKVGDVTVRYWALPFVSPSWTIKDNNLYLALQPQLVASAAALSGKGGSILDDQTFAAARKRLGADNSGSISYVNLQENVTTSYASTLSIVRLGLGMADMFGIQAPAMVLPPLHTLREHLGPAMSTTWSDDAGWHAKSVSPFPGSELFAGEVNLLLSQQGIALSMILPALAAGRHHEVAVANQCATNARMLGQGLLLYANDHKGKYPQTLGEVAEEDVPWRAFICPETQKQPPPDDVQKDAKKLTAWANENADYVYLGATLNPNMPAEIILVYEKPANHPQTGVNVLFNDGHVELMNQAEFARRLQQQQAAPANK